MKRKFELDLTREDLKAFLAKCYEGGTTPAEVLEGFICDLVDGEKTHGSDERRLANNYFDRCGYSIMELDSKSFLQWVLFFDRFDEVAPLADLVRKYEGELSFFGSDEESREKEELEEDLAAATEELRSIYNDYVLEDGNGRYKEEYFQAAIDEITKFNELLKGGKTI